MLALTAEKISLVMGICLQFVNWILAIFSPSVPTKPIHQYVTGKIRVAFLFLVHVDPQTYI